MELPAPAEGGRRGAAGILALAGVAGASTLVVELAAVRLLAPWFGTSSGVWTNVIGVILLALALGYLLGARLAAGARPATALACVLLLSAGFTAWLPGLAGTVCGWFLPEGLALHQAAGLWLWGSLAATLVLFLPPALLLGCVGPLCVELVQVRQASHAGSAGGQVLCVSTLGSLAGTFATTHVLVPGVGLRASFLLAALGLGLAGLVMLLAVWRAGAGRGTTGAAAGLGFGMGMLALLPSGDYRRPGLLEGLELLEQRESRYQSLRVVDDQRWGSPYRLLQVNEGLDSFQSVWAPEVGALGLGFYYDGFAFPAWWTQAERGELSSWRALVLGLGAGTTFRVLEGATPEGVALDLWGVELDEEIVELGRRWFELAPEGAPARHVISGRDARTALRGLPDDFDLIVLDAYAHQVEIPAHLCTREFFELASQHLAPGGWVAVNVGGFGAEDPVVRAVAETLAAVFSESLAVRIPSSRNYVLFARRDSPLPLPGAAGWSFEGPLAQIYLPGLTLPGAVTRFSGEREFLLTDDRSPMDLLQRRSLAQSRERLAAD